MITLGRSLYISSKYCIILHIASKYHYFDIHQYFEIINILKIINTLLNFVNTGAGAGTLSLHEYKYPDKVHRDGFLKYFHKLHLLFHSIGSKNREDRTSPHVLPLFQHCGSEKQRWPGSSRQPQTSPAAPGELWFVWTVIGDSVNVILGRWSTFCGDPSLVERLLDQWGIFKHFLQSRCIFVPH